MARSRTEHLRTIAKSSREEAGRTSDRASAMHPIGTGAMDIAVPRSLERAGEKGWAGRSPLCNCPLGTDPQQVVRDRGALTLYRYRN